MSHFSEDKNGIPPDPRQRTLSNFILAGDASGEKTNDYKPLVPDVCDNTFSVDVNCCPTYCAETSCDLRGTSMENQTSNSTYSFHILRNINEEVNDTVIPQSSEPRPKVYVSLLKELQYSYLIEKRSMIQRPSILIVNMSFYAGS